MKLHEYSKSASFLDLGPRSFRYENYNLYFSETSGPLVTKFHRKAFRNKEMKINKYEFGHMTNGLVALKLGM